MKVRTSYFEKKKVRSNFVVSEKIRLQICILDPMTFCEVKKIQEDRPDSIPSPLHSMKIQIIVGKFY